MKTISYIIFSDLDGALLDHDTYSHQGAEPALEALRAQNVPLVFCTSKTRAEVEAVRCDLGIEDPFIVENGAALFIPRGYFSFPVPAGKSVSGYEVIELGVPYHQVVAALRRAAAKSGCPVRGFHDMSAAQVALRCRLSIRDAERAKSREYDEPFDILGDSPALICSLLRRIEEEGLTWTRGGRFYHVRGRHNKGHAARILTAFFRRSNPETVTVGLGDGPNDVSLLQTVDVPIWIPAGNGSKHRPDTQFKVADYPGPLGWNQAVLRLLAG